MRPNLSKLSSLILKEFEEHIRQDLPVIKDDKDYVNAIQEAIETIIGQVHNLAILGELAEVYSEILNRKLERPARTEVGSTGKGICLADQVRQNCIENISSRIITNSARMNKGIIREHTISNLINGTVTSHNHPFDVLANNKKIEVKYSTLQCPSKKSTTYFRWNWFGLLGTYGTKNFDNLLLIGDVNEKYRARYKDPKSKYVIFDISFTDIRKVASVSSRGILGLALSSNPDVRGDTNQKLFREYQTTLDELANRYGGIF